MFEKETIELYQKPISLNYRLAKEDKYPFSDHLIRIYKP